MMSNKPLVSIIITTCKREMDILERAIKSAVGQTYENKEIILVNDWPPFFEKICELIKKYPRIVFLSNEKQSGACISRNRGIETAKGEFLSPLDDDDEWLPEKIKYQMDKVDDDTVMVYCTNEIILNGKSLKEDPQRRYPEGDVVEELLCSNFISGGPLLRTDTVRKCNGYDPAFQSCQDLDLWIRIAMNGKVKAVIPKMAIAYMGHSSITTGNFERRMQGWERILEKYKKEYEIYPEAYRRFTATMVREAAKRESFSYAVKVWKEYGNTADLLKGFVMKIFRIY